MDKIRVFISSTCYDLTQIRRDLEEFIASLGYEAIMSDSKNIPIPEGLDKIEACKWLVRNSDIFVLIIGGRYGSTDKATGKSIVSIEYETALAARIPIYVFVDKDIWLKRDIYSKLKEMLDAGEIDNQKIKNILGEKIEDPRVFELIKQIDTQEGGRWIIDFQTARDIIESLKNNWSFEFKVLLNSRLERIRYTELKDKSRPILRVDWLIQDKASSILRLKSPTMVDKEELIAKFRNLMVSSKELKEIEIHKDKLQIILKNINHKKLGFRERIFDSDTIISLPSRFNSLIEYNIDRINENFENFLCNIDVTKRTIKPDFQISNDGNVPAQDVIVYINIPEGITILGSEELPIVIHERYPNLTALLAILNNLDGWSKEAEEIERKSTMLESSSSLGWEDLLSVPPYSFNRTGQAVMGAADSPFNISSSSSSARVRYVFLEDDNIRINMSTAKLKHGFIYKEEGDLHLFISSLKVKGKLSLNYRCYADNLLIPDSGELVIEVI